MNALAFDFNREGLREFAELVSALQDASVKFNVDQSGARLLVWIDDETGDAGKEAGK